MGNTDFILYGLLGLIAVLLAIAIIVMIRRNSSNRRDELPDPPPWTAEQTDIPQESEEADSPPELDPLEKYLQHLQTVCQSVRPLGSNEYVMVLATWSLPYTLELAKNTKYYDEPNDYLPTLRLYFTRYEDGSWEISDRGETTIALGQVSKTARDEIEAFRHQIAKTTVALATDGTLRSRGEGYQPFEQTLLDIQETAEAMDHQWTPQVWDMFGLMPATIEQATGTRHEFSGRGRRRRSDPEKTRNFRLRKGAIAIMFDCDETSWSVGEKGQVQLARDNAGIFDSKMTLAEFEEATSVTDAYQVIEGMWRDPHPDVDYHLEVDSHSAWRCTIIQPDLGQSEGGFPHRGGLTTGAMVMGPFRTRARPVRAEIQHEGNIHFQLQFTSLDGTHQTEMFTVEGQCHVEEHETELLPGKEYIACAYGDGPWQIKLTEGY